MSKAKLKKLLSPLSKEQVVDIMLQLYVTIRKMPTFDKRF